MPDRLIWIFIAAALLAVIPGETSQVFGINSLIIIALPYALQGFAIVIFWLNKWNVPQFGRFFIYILVFLQSFGTVALILLGIGDVWFDIRKIRSANDITNSSDRNG